MRHGVGNALRAGVAACLMVAVSPAASLAQLRIGAAGPLTGQYAAAGAEIRAGAERAVADINRAGGVLGQTVLLEVSDEVCDPRQAASIAGNLAGRGVVFVAGHFCAEVSLIAARLYAERRVLMVSAATTRPSLTDQGLWNVFRVVWRDDAQGDAAARHVLAETNARRVAVLHDGSAFGAAIAVAAQHRLRAAGKAEALTAVLAADAREHSTLVETLGREGIDTVIVASYHFEAARFLRQAHAAGLRLGAIGPDTLASPEFAAIAGEAAQGTRVVLAEDPRARPEAAALAPSRAGGGAIPGRHWLATYAAVQVWAAAVRRAGTAEPRRVAEVLRGDGPWQSVLGPLAFDAKGDVVDPAHVIRVWRDGVLAAR